MHQSWVDKEVEFRIKQYLPIHRLTFQPFPLEQRFCEHPSEAIPCVIRVFLGRIAAQTPPSLASISPRQLDRKPGPLGAPPRGSYDVLLDECLQTRSVYTFIQQHVVATLSKLALQQLHYIARVRVMKVTCIMQAFQFKRLSDHLGWHLCSV